MHTDQTEKALRHLELNFHIQRDTRLSSLAEGVAMKTGLRMASSCKLICSRATDLIDR